VVLGELSGRTGYTFVMWLADDANGAETIGFAAGGTGPRAFWALWEADTHNITYENTFDIAHNNVTTYTIEDAVSLDALTGRTGYTFVKWVEEDENGDETTGFDAGTHGAKTFWAVWAPNLPTITQVSSSEAGGMAGSAYRLMLSAAGDTDVVWSTDDDLPDGLELSPDGIISGTPTVTGTFVIVVKATNAVGEEEMEITIIIEPSIFGADDDILDPLFVLIIAAAGIFVVVLAAAVIIQRP
jgi:hypothetical protein